MPVPYSDNLYSADDDLSDADNNHTELSPTDGYFHASSPFDVASLPQPATSDYQPGHLNVPIVPNVMVEDPTLREQDPDAKAREAAEERRLNPSASHQSSPHAAPAPSSSQPSRGYPSLPSHRHRQSEEEQYNTPTPGSGNIYSASSASHSRPQSHTPLIHHGEAPPAYSPSSPTSPHTAGGYQTFGPAFQPADTMGNPAEEHASLLHRDPESMGGPPAGSWRQPWWSRAREAWRRRQHRDLRKVITGLLGFLVILAILLLVLSAVDSGNQRRPGIDPSKPGDDNVKPPIDDDLRWQPTKECYNKPYRFVSFGTQFEFDPTQKLVIIERSEDRDYEGPDGWSPHVTGEVVIKPIEFPYKGEVDIEVLTNHHGLPISADAERNSGRVELVTPRRVKRDGLDRPPCIQIRITIRVPGGSSVAAADVALTHLDLNILEGLKLNVAEDTRLTTTVGNIRTPTTEEKDELTNPSYQLNSREIYVSTMSGNIDGSYPLYDRLKVESVSGDVSIKVEPKPIDSKNPKPAELSVSTLSGNLNVKEPIKAALASPDSGDFPSRDYSVAVETKSGDVTADLAFTSYGRFYSISGNLNVDLWPLLHDAQQSTIIGPEVATDTKGGDTTLDLHEPHWAATGSAARLPVYPSSPSWIGYPPLIGGPSSEEEEGESDSNQASGTHAARPLTLYSSHSSVSGDIHLRYPSAWEGYLKAQTVSGNQRFHGEGLEVTRRGKLPMAILEGYKGHDGHSDLRVESISGNQDFVVGEN
ncbi:unnamed protein product [Clonostachys solani]|uniref:Adhesin domain-containing protein n=1 Tax=Clonostachys solani TaxID=160281 RepID=A0A9N9Z6D0_9HYPO|nr:unnamed protein product [Clonostachys solani]